FDQCVFAIVATFLVSFFGYLLWPALGPRVPAGHEAEVLGGTEVRAAVFGFLHTVERNQLDAFPSGHTAVSLVVLALGARLLPTFRVPLAIVVGSIVFSTVYLSVHYVIDIAAGTLLAASMPIVVRVIGPFYGVAGWPASGICEFDEPRATLL